MSLCRYLPTPSDRMGILWSLLCIEGSVVLEYGPAGTTHYSVSLFGSLGVDQQNRLFTTHMSEDDVVMGDVSRLERALVEIDQAYAPRVIFVVASSVSRPSSARTCAAYAPTCRKRCAPTSSPSNRAASAATTALACARPTGSLPKHAVTPANERVEGTYNLLGLSAGAYRARSDRNEICRLMREAFGMEMRACLCLDTDMETIEGCGAAELNLVLRGEALPAAEILEKNCHTPCVAGMPYGYAGTLDWLHRVGAALGREPNGALVRELEARHAEAAQMHMYGHDAQARPPRGNPLRRIRDGAGTRRPVGRDGGIAPVNKISAHSLHALPERDPSVLHLPVEKERIELMRGLHRQLVLADESLPHTARRGQHLRLRQPAARQRRAGGHAHCPSPGRRAGADFILEHIGAYLDTLS